jgi:hypothetical protein
MWDFLRLFVAKTIFICRNKNRTLTYRRLIGFMASFVYLGFLNTRLSLGPSIFPIPLVLRYKVTSGSRFYQTWFLIFQVFIYFIGGCLTMYLRCSHQLVLELGFKNQVISFIFFLLVSTFLTLVVYD